MVTKEDLNNELRDACCKCADLHNIAWRLNDNENTRTVFTQKVVTYMGEVIQTLGALIDEND